MRVLLLTSSLAPNDGYGVLSSQLKRGMSEADPGLETEVFTGDARRFRFIGRDALRCGRARANPVSRTFAILADALNVLLLKRGRFDVIHAVVEHHAVTAMVLSRLLRIPYVITAAGTYAVKLPVESLAYGMAFRKADRILSISRYTGRRMREERVEGEVTVITLGADKSVFTPDSSVPRENSVTFVGNLKARKGLDFLLDAMAMVNRRRPDIKLLVLGRIDRNSPRFLEIEAFIREKGINVEFLGFTPVEDLVRRYRQAKLNALPSKSEPFFFEGFGLIHVEANACGTLTVGTLDSGNEDAIAEGFGKLVRYGDVPALAEAILDACSISPYPVLDVDKVPDWKDVGSKYVGIYREVGGRKRARGAATGSKRDREFSNADPVPL